MHTFSSTCPPIYTSVLPSLVCPPFYIGPLSSSTYLLPHPPLTSLDLPPSPPPPPPPPPPSPVFSHLGTALQVLTGHFLLVVIIVIDTSQGNIEKTFIYRCAHFRISGGNDSFPLLITFSLLFTCITSAFSEHCVTSFMTIRLPQHTFPNTRGDSMAQSGCQYYVTRFHEQSRQLLRGC